MKKLTVLLGQFLPLGAAIATVIVLPNMFFDAVSIPKITVLVLVAFLSLGILLALDKTSIGSVDKTFDVLLYFFITILILNLALKHNTLSERFYGIQGRYFGFLTILSYAIVAWLSARILKSRVFLKFLVLSNSIVCV